MVEPLSARLPPGGAQGGPAGRVAGQFGDSRGQGGMAGHDSSDTPGKVGSQYGGATIDAIQMGSGGGAGCGDVRTGRVGGGGVSGMFSSL